ncbi:MAG: type II toxin-antitoxin system VapB family antitoxin [Longimicrobiales bacterium]
MARAATPKSGGSKAKVRRKNLNIDQVKLDRARRILGVQTETEAVDQALSMLLFREELVQGIREIGGTGGVENYFNGDSAS